ncbi:uroporphyrinogen decarboxylase [Eilatimonas milleporae]|uniref:Uroporphyrinogen decarboxylase n=1 Tax=Eilatimonas milleporae TaxID=911205 RepID=A0A3M0C414_9PROT|nr:uroporphyrinogen decarboxylase [Eilatimonas milleporae]RMB01839.1 uroporphyrinogen decarboxylase [Eilatimonas milleporae]
MPDRSKRLLLNTLKGQPGERVPFWFMRQAGRYLSEYREVRATTSSFMEFCYSPDKAAEVTLQPVRRFATDGAILFADILVVPDGLGQKVWFEPGKGPQLTAVSDEAGFSALTTGGPDMAGFHDRVGAVYETVRRVRAGLPDSVTLLGFAGAPWTVATYMVEGQGSRDHAAARQMGYGQADLFGRLLDMLVEATSAYLIAQIDAGADAVQIFDSWAAALPEPYFRAWVIEPTRAIVERVKAVHGETPIIGFPRLAGSLTALYAAETGVDALSLDTGVSLSWAADTLQTKMPVQGNLDPHLVVAGGPAMHAEAARILDTLNGGAHIFNLGHGFVPQTPVEHVAALSDQIRAFRR